MVHQMVASIGSNVIVGQVVICKSLLTAESFTAITTDPIHLAVVLKCNHKNTINQREG